MTKRANVPFLSLHHAFRGARRWIAPRIREIVHTSRCRRRCHSSRIRSTAGRIHLRTSKGKGRAGFEQAEPQEGAGRRNTDAMSARGQERRYRPRPPTVRCYNRQRPYRCTAANWRLGPIPDAPQTGSAKLAYDVIANRRVFDGGHHGCSLARRVCLRRGALRDH